MALYEDVKSSIETYFENYTIIIEKTALMLDCTTTFYMKAAPFLVSKNKKLCVAQSSLRTFEDEVKNNSANVANFLRLAFKSLQYMQNANFIECLNMISINKNECDEIKICKEKLKDSNILLITQDSSIKNLVLNLNQENNEHHIVVKCFVDDGILSDFA